MLHESSHPDPETSGEGSSGDVVTGFFDPDVRWGRRMIGGGVR